MANYIFDKKGLQKVDKIKELGDKVCKLVEYYEQGKGRVFKLAALADVLSATNRILKSHDERFKEIEERLKDKERRMVCQK